MSKKRMKAIVILVLIGVIYIVTCTRLKTPEIRGVVLNAETGEPIADAKIYAKWERKMRGFGGESSGGIDKVLHLKTKADGTFSIPAHTLFNFIPSPIGVGGYFYMFVYTIGYKNLIFDFFDPEDFEGPPKPRFREFEGVTKGERLVLKMSKVEDPKAFIKYRGEVSSKIDKDDDYRRKEDQWFVGRFGSQKWHDRMVQYELAEAYHRLGNDKSALKKLDEILEMDPSGRTKYFNELYEQYKSNFKKK